MMLLKFRDYKLDASHATFGLQDMGTYNRGMTGVVGYMPTTVTCYASGGFGHVSKQRPAMNSFQQSNQLSPKLCFNCQKPGHIAGNCLKRVKKHRIMCKMTRVRTFQTDKLLLG